MNDSNDLSPDDSTADTPDLTTATSTLQAKAEDDHLPFLSSRERGETGSKQSRIIALLISIFFFPVILTTVATITDRPVEEGELSPRTILAGSPVTVADEEGTQTLREQARNDVEPVFRPDNAAIAAIIQDVAAQFEHYDHQRQRRLAAMNPDGTPQPTERPTDDLDGDPAALDDEGVQLVLGMSDHLFSETKNLAITLAQRVASKQITITNLESVKDNDIPTWAASSGASYQVATKVLTPIVAQATRPTAAVDEAATRAAQDNAERMVEPIVYTVARGQPIVQVGEAITPLQYKALTQAGLRGTDPFIEFNTAFMVMVAMTLAVSIILRTNRTQVWKSGQHLILLTLCINLMAVFMAVAELFQHDGPDKYFALPVAAITMLVTILFDSRVALVCVGPILAMLAIKGAGNPMVLPFAAFMSILPIPMVGRLSARGDLRIATTRLLAASVLSSVLLHGVVNGTDHVNFVAGMGLLHGLLTMLLVIGLLPFLESNFDVTTSTILLEYADRNNTLMRELESQAIGTYNHSVMVAMLASRCARAVRADGLLAEVMALYHDIGKVARPYFFVENQTGLANPHDELNDPLQSAVIIRKHVEDGVEMATLHKLPTAIIDGIRTHHGTTLVAYFYRVAAQHAADHGDEGPDEADYRYHGVKPFTKEQAILMLSDCCEGATRAASQSGKLLTEQQIRSIVTGLITDRINDGQLDDSPLTFNDVRIVEEILIDSLVGVYHPRIAYPDPVKPKATPVTHTPSEPDDTLSAEQPDGEGDDGPCDGQIQDPSPQPAP